MDCVAVILNCTKNTALLKLAKLLSAIAHWSHAINCYHTLKGFSVRDLKTENSNF